MNFASQFAYVASKQRKSKQSKPLEQTGGVQIPYVHHSSDQEDDLNLNVFVVTFDGIKNAEKQLAGGDPYNCKKCRAILNKNSKVLWQQDLQKLQLSQKIQLGKTEALWECEFCTFKNIVRMQRQQIPLKDDVVYILQSELMGHKNENDSTLVFCIDTSGSMNHTSAIQGKVELKYGISPEQIEMLRQFMEPGDEAQFNYLPGIQNQNKTFISRKQCIFSAIQSQINAIKKQNPYKRIGFVTFGSEVIVLGDSKSETIHLVGDKLNDKLAITNSLNHFKLQDSIQEAYGNLLNNINKTQAKGQTALGPALITALQIAGKGSPGSSVILCTDGLANIGVGQLQPYDQQKIKFYSQLGEWAKEKNITVNIITIKGEGCKIEAIGKLAQRTNGNIKIVNPQKLSDDFANVLKDQVVGLNVLVRVLLHNGMTFRNQSADNLREEGCVLERALANATKNTRISFQYNVRSEEQLEKFKVNLKNLKQLPFQAQIQYTSPNGGKFLRVISSLCNTTESKEEMSKKANLGVIHQRITNKTAALYRGGDYKGSKQFNSRWANYLDKNFKQSKFQAHQNKFAEKNERLNKAIKHRHRKSIEKKKEAKQQLSQDEIKIMNNLSQIQSDEDQCELVDNLMERQCYSIAKSFNSSSGSKQKKEKGKKQQPQKKQKNKNEKIQRKNSNEKQERKVTPRKQRKKSIKRKSSFCSNSDYD